MATQGSGLLNKPNFLFCLLEHASRRDWISWSRDHPGFVGWVCGLHSSAQAAELLDIEATACLLHTGAGCIRGMMHKFRVNRPSPCLACIYSTIPAVSRPAHLLHSHDRKECGKALRPDCLLTTPPHSICAKGTHIRPWARPALVGSSPWALFHGTRCGSPLTHMRVSDGPNCRSRQPYGNTCYRSLLLRMGIMG